MRAGSVVASGTRHALGMTVQAILVASIVAAIVFAAAVTFGRGPAGAGSVFAAKGGHGGSITSTDSSILLDQAGASLALGDKVTFTTAVVGLTGNEYALVYLKCMEGDTVVYGQLDTPDTTFVLGGGSSPWWRVGGQATCVGYLQAYGTHSGIDTIRTLATTKSFSAN